PMCWEDRVRISARAAAIDEAQVYLIAGEEWTIRQLFEAMAIYSANDATVALAEHLAGSEETFVKWMNEKAKELKMTNTHFRNSTGLNEASYPNPPKGEGKHVMSARDARSEEHTSELQSRENLVCRLLLAKND